MKLSLQLPATQYKPALKIKTAAFISHGSFSRNIILPVLRVFLIYILQQIAAKMFQP